MKQAHERKTNIHLRQVSNLFEKNVIWIKKLFFSVSQKNVLTKKHVINIIIIIKEIHTYTETNIQTQLASVLSILSKNSRSSKCRKTNKKQTITKTNNTKTSKILFLFKWPFPGRQDLFLFFLKLAYAEAILLFGCRPRRMGYCCQWKQIFNIWK